MKNTLFWSIIFILLSNTLFSQLIYQDTVFIERVKNDSIYHRIFFDTNKRSVFYDYISTFEFDQFGHETYNRSIEYLKTKKIKLNKQNYGDLPKEWVMAQFYKGQIYMYSPSDFYSHYKVKFTDTAIIDWNGEGPEAMRVKSFKRIDSLHYKINVQSQYFVERNLEITFIDKLRGIAVFHDIISPKSIYWAKERYILMVDVNKMRDIPLIVNICDNSKMSELKFDEIDIKKLIKH